MIIRQRRPLLDERLCGLRYSPSKVLLNNLKSASPGRIVFFSDKKMSTISEAYNRRNNCYLAMVDSDGDVEVEPGNKYAISPKKTWFCHVFGGCGLDCITQNLVQSRLPSYLGRLHWCFFFNSQDAWRGWPTQAALCVAAGQRAGSHCSRNAKFSFVGNWLLVGGNVASKQSGSQTAGLLHLEQNFS